MKSGLSSLLKIHIDFQQSHTFFPTIVTWVMGMLLVAIFVVYGIPYIRSVSRGERKISFSMRNIDTFRLLGTLILTVIYFLSMDYVGGFFPNTGLGFLFMSVPFMFLLSLLYVHGLNRMKLLIMSLNAIIAPGIAWLVLAKLFRITLP